MFKLKEELKVILIYLIIGFSWIYFSDKILLVFVADQAKISKLQTYKGIFYVISTALIFYFLFRKYLNNLRAQKIELKNNNRKLKRYNQEIKNVNAELDHSLNKLEELNQRFVKMINSISSLNEKTKLDEEEFLSDLLSNIIEIVPEADYGKIYLIENNQCRFIDTVGHDIDILRDIKIDEKHILNFKSKGVYFSKDFSITVDDLPEVQKNKFEQALKKTKESMYINIEIKNKVVGRISLDIAEDSKKSFNQGTINILESFSTLASSFFAYKRFDKLQGKFTKELISSIIKILEMYDVYTKGHSENVANLSLLIAEELGLSEEQALDSYWSGMVHDIGKLLLPVQILNKKGKLEEFEYDLIKKHPLWSSQALSDSETLEYISENVLYHHERWDGRGYPEGLKADAIPLISQIIAIADAWDAMTSDRSYRSSLSKKEALREIRENRGSQFSPRAADAFLRVIETKELDIKNDIKAKFEVLESEDFELDKNNYFETLFKKSNEGIVILDEDFKIKRVNEYFIELFGFRESEILGEDIRNVLIPAEKKDEVEININNLTSKREVNSQTYRKKKGGKRIDVEVQAFPLTLREDEVEYYVIYRDISELADAKSKYENYKGRYEALFENESTVMLIIDPDSGEIIDANPAAVNFYGWSKAELKSMKISDINILTDEEVKKEMEKTRRQKKQCFNFTHQNQAGELKEVEVYSQPIKFGERDFLYSIIHLKKDIKTAKKRCSD